MTIVLSDRARNITMALHYLIVCIACPVVFFFSTDIANLPYLLVIGIFLIIWMILLMIFIFSVPNSD
jgi:hypothetical protein